VYTNRPETGIERERQTRKSAATKSPLPKSAAGASDAEDGRPKYSCHAVTGHPRRDRRSELSPKFQHDGQVFSLKIQNKCQRIVVQFTASWMGEERRGFLSRRERSTLVQPPCNPHGADQALWSLRRRIGRRRRPAKVFLSLRDGSTPGVIARVNFRRRQSVTGELLF
jgi:hypothetical protein